MISFNIFLLSTFLFFTSRTHIYRYENFVMYFPYSFSLNFSRFFFFLLFFLLHIHRVPPLWLQINNSVLIHAKLLFNPSIKIYLHNFQNLSWFSATFSMKLWLIIATCSWILVKYILHFFSLKFSSEFYLRSAVLSFILILFHLYSPQLSVCLYWHKKDYFWLSLRLFEFVFPNGVSLKWEGSTI